MNVNFLENIVRPDWLEFVSYKIKNTRVVWMNAEADCLHSTKKHSNISEDDFLNEYAYAISETEFFRGLGFDKKDSKTLTAERYGGPGIGSNGGGVRCGNLDGMQLKGIGTNCLVGDHGNIEHSYGGLDARKAIVETIYTHVLGKVLPLGTVKIHGLIFTGEKTAFNGKEPCWGVIMVRDTCIRPAHFMRAPAFKPLTKHERNLTGDLGRIRSLNRRLAQQLGTTNEFIMLIGRYLQNAANQFAFARAARITHGTMSPSNISIDGSWLDLPVASFLSGGINYNIWSQFYTEHNSALNYALEIIHSYAKYNLTTLNPTPLIHYFNEQFDNYLTHYIGFILGLDLKLLKNLNPNAWKQVADIFRRIINSSRYIEASRPTPQANDPVHALITACFISTTDYEKSIKYYAIAGINAQESVDISLSFNIVIDDYIALVESDIYFLETRYRAITPALVALKRCYLSEAFYLPAVDNEVKYLCSEKSPDDIAPLINSYTNMADWIFAESTKEICLYQSDVLHVVYSVDQNVYHMKSQWGGQEVFGNYERLYCALQKIGFSTLILNNFDFAKYFQKMKNVIPSLEKEYSIAMEAENV